MRRPFVVWTYSGFLRSRGGGLERPFGLESRYRLANLYSNQPFLSTLPNVSRIPKEKTATSERWGWPFLAVVGPAWAMTWRCKSSRNLVAGTEGKRKAFVVRRTLNEA